MTKNAQYEVFSGRYGTFVVGDPNKQFAQYYSVLQSVQPVRGRTMLDVGCGSGELSRKLAAAGAKVIAYDLSAPMIALAMSKSYASRIDYRVADAETFTTDHLVDDAVSVMVLPYAMDVAALMAMFRSTFAALKPGGRFISVVFNPSFRSFGRSFCNRRFTKLDRKLHVEFLDGDVVAGTARFSRFTKRDYERTARQAGFTACTWQPLSIDPRSRRADTASFWRSFRTHQPYMLFSARKPE